MTYGLWDKMGCLAIAIFADSFARPRQIEISHQSDVSSLIGAHVCIITFVNNRRQIVFWGIEKQT